MDCKTNLPLPLVKIATSLALLLTVAGMPACAAKYETIHRDGPAGASEGSGTGTGPATADQVPAALPTAGVEVIVSGAAVTTVTVGQPFTVHPTADTTAPNASTTKACPNPGIASVLYKLSDGAILNVARGGDCADLGAPHSVASPGAVLITMQVASDTGATAMATMTLNVVPVGAPAVPGFTCSATPTIATPGTEITASGDCANGTIAWDFGDGAKGTGATVQHPYSAPGQFTIAAICTRPDGVQTGSVGVTIIPAGSSSGGATTGGTGYGTTGGTGNGTTGGTGNGTTGGTGYGTTGGTGNGTTGGTGYGTTGGTGNGTTGGTTGGTGYGTTGGTTGGTGYGTTGGTTGGTGYGTTGGTGYGTTGGTTGGTGYGTTGSTTGGTGYGTTGGTTGGTGGPTQTPVQGPVQAPIQAPEK